MNKPMPLRLLLTVLIPMLGLAGAGQAQQSDPGERVFRRACAACHALEPGQRRIGPSLHGVAGARAARAPDYRYSPALASSGITWTDAELDAFLLAPREAVPGNRMAYPGLADPADRAALIRFLKTQR